MTTETIRFRTQGYFVEVPLEKVEHITIAADTKHWVAYIDVRVSENTCDCLTINASLEEVFEMVRVYQEFVHVRRK